MKQCTNCGIVIGGELEKVLHSYNGLRICSVCVETLKDRGWLRRARQGGWNQALGRREAILVITFIDGSQYTVPEDKFKPGGLTWQQLQEKLAQYRD